MDSVVRRVKKYIQDVNSHKDILREVRDNQEGWEKDYYEGKVLAFEDGCRYIENLLNGIDKLEDKSFNNIKKYVIDKVNFMIKIATKNKKEEKYYLNNFESGFEHNEIYIVKGQIRGYEILLTELDNILINLNYLGNHLNNL